MSEVDRKEFDNITTTESVAAVISSALETTAGTDDDQNDDTLNLHTGEDQQQPPTIVLRNRQGERLLGNHVESLVTPEEDVSRTRPFLRRDAVVGVADCDLKVSSGRESGNHVGKASGLKGSPAQHSMGEKPSDPYKSNELPTGGRKSDNRETDKVSDCAEKSASLADYEAKSCDPTPSYSRVFKPSSKIIELPDKTVSARPSPDHNSHHYHHHHRNKESKIPVGIAVAWQRLVTSSTTSSTTAPAMATKADIGSVTQRRNRSNNSDSEDSTQNRVVSSCPVKQPSRPLSASPVSHSRKTPSGKPHPYSSSTISTASNSYASRSVSSEPRNGFGESDRPLSACGDPGLVPFPPGAASPISRPLPSSSVPPNMGFPTGNPYQYSQHSQHHRGPYFEYPYMLPGNSGGGGGGGNRTFAVPSPVHSPHHHTPHPHPALLGNGHYWGGTGLENPCVPLLSPGGGDYMQQLSIQQQMHFHQHQLLTSRQSSSPYNPYLSLMYPHHHHPDSPTKNSYYDHYFHQNELLRHHQHSHSPLDIHHRAGEETGGYRRTGEQSDGVTTSVNVNGCKSGGSGSSISTSNNGNVTTSSRSVGGFDLLANNNNTTASHQDRVTPMQVASPITAIPMLSPSCTGGLRTPTPTSSSSSQSSSSSSRATSSSRLLEERSSAVAYTKAGVRTGCITTSTTTTPSQFQPSDEERVLSSQSVTGAEAQPLSSPSSIGASAPVVAIHSQPPSSSSSSLSSRSSASSPSPSFLLLHHHHQQHPHLFTSSSAALSPKSLTSSTPSPVTVHDLNSGLNVVIGNSNSKSGSCGYQIGSNNNSSSSSNNNMLATSRKCATPSPIALTPRGLLSPFGSPFSPSPVPTHPANNNTTNKDLAWRSDSRVIKPIGTDEGKPDSLTTTPTSSPSLIRRIQMNVPTPLSSPSHKHDFKRLESLIERRDSESISPLVLIPQHSPASTTSSTGDKALVMMEEADGVGGDDNESKPQPVFPMKIENDETEDECDCNGATDRTRLETSGDNSKGGRDSPIRKHSAGLNEVKPPATIVIVKREGDGEDTVQKTNGSSPTRRENSVGGTSTFDRDLDDDNVERNSVPESTLPTNDKYYVRNSCNLKEDPAKANQFEASSQNVSYTSGYSSSHDISLDLGPGPGKQTGKCKGGKEKGAPSLLQKREKKAKKPLDSVNGKATKPKRKDKCGEVVKQKRKVDDSRKGEKEKKSSKGKPPPPSPEFLKGGVRVLDPVKKFGRKRKKGDNDKPKTEENDSFDKTGKKERKDKAPRLIEQGIKKNATKHGIITLPTSETMGDEPRVITMMSNVVTNNYNTPVNNSTPYFVPTPAQLSGQPVTSEYGGTTCGSDRSCSFSSPGGEQPATSSLISTTNNKPHVAVILHSPPQPLFTQPVSCSNQVTFLITSPPQSLPTSAVAESAIRIPAYIPRSTGSSTSAMSIPENFPFPAEELGGSGDGYSGAATLTLHRDEQQIGYYQQQQQHPPQITIQYHHSAPATPSMECASPQYAIKPEENHLNLLATVAQEFGSREDLGKRPSIDGSCSNSIIGESPPMSPQKSPYSSQYLQPVASTCLREEAIVLGDNHVPVPRVVSAGVPPQSRKESQPSKKSKKMKVMEGKTTNSITKPKKAGKKEKRTVSDSASYSPPVVYLKIPQILPKRATSPSKSRKLKEEKIGKKSSSKKVTGIQGSFERKVKTEKKIKKCGEAGKGFQEGEHSKKKMETNKNKKLAKGNKLAGKILPVKPLLVSPLKLQIPSSSTTGGACSPVTPLMKDKVKSPAGSICFYNPPERISAFAKQAIARRDSTSTATSPTKPLSESGHGSEALAISTVFFPSGNQLKPPPGTNFEESARDSPLLKMPLLTPYDLPLEDIEEPRGVDATGGAMNKSSVAAKEVWKEVDSGMEEKGKKTESTILDGSRNESTSSSSKHNGHVKKGSGEKERKRRKGRDVPLPLTFLPEKKKKRKHRETISGGELIPLPDKKRKKRVERSHSFPVQNKWSPVPKAGTPGPGGSSYNHQYSSPGPEGSKAFSPLTPPPTAKPLVKGKNKGDRGSTLLEPMSRHSSPNNVENELDTENENENDFNNWVADPMFAVSAIKICSGSTPHVSDVGEDVDNTEGGREPKVGKPPKLTLLSVKNKMEDEDDSRSEDDDRCSRFLEVKSELKAFVHFKPKQMTGYKGNARHHHIKPCLKAEPVVRSQGGGEEEEDDDDEQVELDDEDFQLDLEVAKLTTGSGGGGARRKASGGSISSATSSTTSSKKHTINRNSRSYLSTSSSIKKHPSTKEIMRKVFSRKVSPELLRDKKKRRHSSNTKKQSTTLIPPQSQPGTEMDADDEEEDDDADEPVRQKVASMTAAAAAVVVNNPSNLASSTTGTSPPVAKKCPKKRSARSSTTSSCASSATAKNTNRSSRGNKGLVSGPSSSNMESTAGTSKDETLIPGKVQLDSVAELVDEMRILTEIQGLFYTGRLNALQPPDVYGVTLDNERGAPPHIIFSAEEVLEKCLREKKPQTLSSGLRICAYWSPQYSGLYPGRVSSDFNPKFDPEKDLIPIEFDDGDTGMIKLKEIRLLSTNHPVRDYDPNPLLTLEKKHRKRRHSSATGTSVGCTGDHDEADCGEPYCAKVGKLEEDEEEDEEEDGRQSSSSSKVLYWTWSGLGYKRPKSKKNRNKEFFHGIQRGNEVINLGDAALFISTGNERPFIGRIERFWESKGKKMVNVRWFYHPEEVKASAKRLSNLKYPGALFESPHIDENDVQTIAKKCDVLPFTEFKQRLSSGSGGSLRLAKLSAKSSSKPRDMYYVAGFYDPYTYNLTLNDLK